MSVLLIGRVQHGERHRLVEFQLSDCERCEFPFAKPRQNERLVNQRPLPPEPLQLLDELGIVGQPLPCPLDCRLQSVQSQRGFRPTRPLAAFAGRFGLSFIHGDSFPAELGERSQPRHLQQLEQFGFRHCPPLPSPIALFVGLGESGEGIRGEPPVRHGPITESRQGFRVGVASAGRHPFRLASRQPALDGMQTDVAESVELAIPCQAVCRPSDFREVLRGNVLGSQREQVRAEVIGERLA
ncbi:MAG: hypothetical protein NTZ32_22040 [Planctomycetales bacterium]|nr:hypothetical protein [Planctomycetales bacterium]